MGTVYLPKSSDGLLVEHPKPLFHQGFGNAVPWCYTWTDHVARIQGSQRDAVYGSGGEYLHAADYSSCADEPSNNHGYDTRALANGVADPTHRGHADVGDIQFPNAVHVGWYKQSSD